jgi:hypothetical protein
MKTASTFSFDRNSGNSSLEQLGAAVGRLWNTDRESLVVYSSVFSHNLRKDLFEDPFYDGIKGLLMVLDAKAPIFSLMGMCVEFERTGQFIHPMEDNLVLLYGGRVVRRTIDEQPAST